jgi:hypothetical protein
VKNITLIGSYRKQRKFDCQYCRQRRLDGQYCKHRKYYRYIAWTTYVWCVNTVSNVSLMVNAVNNVSLMVNTVNHEILMVNSAMCLHLWSLQKINHHCQFQITNSSRLNNQMYMVLLTNLWKESLNNSTHINTTTIIWKKIRSRWDSMYWLRADTQYDRVKNVNGISTTTFW